MKLLRLLYRRHLRRLQAERDRTKAWKKIAENAQLTAENAELAHKVSLLVLGQQRRRMKEQAAEHLRLIEENASLHLALEVLLAANRSTRTWQAEIGRMSGARPYFHARVVAAGSAAISGTATADDAGQPS